MARRESVLDRNGDLLATFGQPVAAEIARRLGDCGVPDGRAMELEKLRCKHAVYRVRARAEDGLRSLIIKRVHLDEAERIRLTLRRWLPWLGLEGAAPALLGAAAGDGAERLWHLYEDGGDKTLHAYRSDLDRVAGAVDLIAELHTRASGHPVVAECRRDGHDLGIHFFMNSVTDALSLLDAIEPPMISLSREQAQVRERLRRRLARLLDDATRRAEVMEAAGGPATMLHGDLWTTNILIDPTGDGVRLIDWDRVGAGPFSYDLSILLYRFGAEARAWILDRYRKAVVRTGWRLAPVAELNLLFDTAECARYAYRISWPAIALLRDGAQWGFGELAEIDGWFEALAPVIPA
jgi:hypothetical protein